MKQALFASVVLLVSLGGLSSQEVTNGLGTVRRPSSSGGFGSNGGTNRPPTSLGLLQTNSVLAPPNVLGSEPAIRATAPVRSASPNLPPIGTTPSLHGSGLGTATSETPGTFPPSPPPVPGIASPSTNGTSALRFGSGGGPVSSPPGIPPPSATGR